MGDINLAGYITGYGIVHKDGTVTEHTYDTPIHNKIVKSGINQMLRYNGSNTGGYYLNQTWGYRNEYNIEQYAVFRENTGNHYGCLHFCQLGTNNEPTNFFDEELREPFSIKSTSIKANSPYTYTNIDNAYQYTIWITYTFDAFTEDKEIGEIGYFGRYQLDANDSSTIEYPMFSRIALPEKISVKVGEEFYCTYKLVIKVDSEAHDIDNFMGIEGQKAQMKYCPYSTYTGIMTHSVYDSITPFPCITQTGKKYYPRTMDNVGTAISHCFYRGILFPQVLYNNYYTYITNDPIYSYGLNNDYIKISTTNRNFPATNSYGTSTNNKLTDYINLCRANENCSHQFVDYNPNRNYRDIKLIVPKYNPNLNTVDNQKITFYNIYCRGYEYRLGYYTDDGNGTKTWVPQPMTKWVNEKWTFTCRTTINTEDTDAWMAGILKPEDYNAEFLTSDNTYITACYWTDIDGKNHINTTDLDQEQPSLNFKFKMKNKFNEKIMTDFVSCNIKLVGETDEIIKSFNFGTDENELVYEQTGCKVYLEDYEDISEGKYAVYMQFIDKNDNESEYIKMFDGNKVIRE